MEHLQFSFEGVRPAGRFAPVLVGVVGSGNLEVLLEPTPGRLRRIQMLFSDPTTDPTATLDGKAAYGAYNPGRK